jgi:RHS repeat-associated protein
MSAYRQLGEDVERIKVRRRAGPGHDPVGDLTAIDRSGGSNDWFFSYSSWNQLTKAERSPGSGDVTYTLDALDRVLSRASTGATSQYTYQGSGEVLAKSVVAGSTTTYAHTPGGPLAQKIGSTTRYYLRDLHGDLVGWSNTNGALQGTALYDPWGELLSGTGDMAVVPTNGAFRFQSDLTDAATGQVDMLARLYESVLGRFSSRDPLLGEPTDPPTLNQYVYGLASPVTYDDPTGLCADPDICPPQVGFGTTQTHSKEFVSDINSAGDKWSVAQRWVPPPPPTPVPGALATYTNRLPRLVRLNAQASATYPFADSEDDGVCHGFWGCAVRGISWAPDSATHLGYRGILQAGRCAKYALTCFEDFNRTVVVPSALATGVVGGVALGVSACGATAGLGCGVGAVVGGAVTIASGGILVAYWRKMLGN